MNKRELEELSIIFKALSHPTRLWMVEQLFEAERCVCEFVDVLKLDFSTVSKH
ncbi:MAG: ArsR family transcriptional regulator, partial [Candidatus Neomarinimicrobiota bacterium]